MGNFKAIDTERKDKKQKSPMRKFGIKQFHAKYGTDEQCLEYLKDRRWPNGIHCPKCDKVTTHHLITKRKCYSCQDCSHQTYPTAGTIFHKSRTPLTIWFEVVFRMGKTRGGVSAKAIERETGVTYKTAWRMCKLIRQQMDEGKNPLGGIEETVEVDETYYGAKTKIGKRGRGSENKTPVIGLVERSGRVHTQVKLSTT